jgi:DNA-binding NtrC family response regulator
MLKGRRIALIEDDEIMGGSIAQRLELEGASVLWRKQAQRAIGELRTPRAPIDSVVCDIRLPDGSGEEIFNVLCKDTVPPPFLFITGQGDIGQAVRLLRAGAADYILKPFEMNLFLQRLSQLMKPKTDAVDPEEFGVSPVARRIAKQVGKVSATGRHVLIRGPAGTGKGRVARMIHAMAGFPASSFAEFNFLRNPDVGDAFKDAVSAADGGPGGTFFINGFSRMSLAAQDVLFDALETMPEYRIIASCGIELERGIADGGFRSDLLSRLQFLEIAVPALRERPDDALWLFNRMFQALNAKREMPLKAPSSFTEEAIRSYDWPGNGRELRSRLQRAMETVEGDQLFPSDLFPEWTAYPNNLPSLAQAREAAERTQIIVALERCGGHVGEAARLLDISRTTLWEKMQKFGL